MFGEICVNSGVSRAPVSRDLDDAEVARLRADLVTLSKRYPKLGDLAAALGMHQSGLSRLMSGKQGASHGTAARVAELLGTEAPAAKQAAPRERVYQPEERYPSRAQAIALLRGIVPDAVLDSLRFSRAALEADDDPGLEWWMSEAKRLNKLREDLAKEVKVEVPERRR